MSTLIIEVCEVASVERHPHADRLGIATVKGWKTAIGLDPATQTFEFAPGERCVYFPPDAVLPPALANSPYRVCKTKGCKAINKTPTQLSPEQRAVDGQCALCGNAVDWRDGTPGRTGAAAFCAALPKGADGVRPPGVRVVAARIRGLQSFGFIMKLDAAQGDDESWAVGTDVREHFGVTKWEPPIENVDGAAAAPHADFHAYTDIEHLANFPGVLADGDEVIVTEKLHGKNARLGLAIEDGTRTFMAGSHGVRRLELAPSLRRFPVVELVEKLVLSDATDVAIGRVFAYDGGKFWRIVNTKGDAAPPWVEAEEVVRTGGGEFVARQRRSEFWEPMADNVRALLAFVLDEYEWPEPKRGVVLFGELTGTQDMKYGLRNARGFAAFDLAINGRYVDSDELESLCDQFGVATVPTLWRGPFSVAKLAELTDGPTVMCKPEEAGPFGGREGVVVKPAIERIDERMIPTSTNGRVIFKSISADYLARKGGTDAH